MAADAWVLQALVDTDDQAVFVLDTDLRYLAFNQAHAAGMRALYGAEIELGERLTDYQTVAADREGAEEHVGRALAGERIVVSAYSGEEGRERRYYDIVHTPLTDEDGTVSGVVVRTNDITDRRVAEDGLRASEHRYTALFESMLEGYAYCRMLYDADGRPVDWVYLAVNPAFERLTGLAGVTGKPVTEVLPTVASQTPELLDLYGAVVRTGEAAEFDIDFTPLGLWLHVSAFRPEPDHFVAVFVDVSESRRAEQEAARSHAELKTLVDTVPEIVFQIDRDYRLVVANKLFRRATISAEGRPILPGDCVLAPGYPSEFNELWRSYYDRALAGESFAAETTIHMDDGKHIMDNHLRPVRDSGGDVVGAIVAARDVTESRRAEQAVRHSEARYRGYFEQSLVGAAVTSPEKGWIEVNQATCDLLGYTREELRQLTWAELTHPDDLAADVAQFERVLAREIDGYRLEKRFLRKDGEVVDVDLSVKCQRTEDGAVDYFLALLLDITERKLAEAEIKRLNSDLEERVAHRTHDLTAANAELEEFVYSIAHDLRSPLRALSGFSELIELDFGGVIDETGRDYLRRIRDAAGHLGRLMDALLSLSKIGQRQLELRDVDLSGLALEVAEELQATFPERVVDVEIEQGLVARGDPALCEIIVQNLLGNAWKFSAVEQHALIRFTTERVDERRVFCVSDNGVGFDPEFAGKLFTPFERLHTRDEFPGTGIGLATVRRAVTRLGGRCWADAEQGGGARLYFTLQEPD